VKAGTAVFRTDDSGNVLQLPHTVYHRIVQSSMRPHSLPSH